MYSSFQKFAGLYGIAAGISGFLYSIAFLFLQNATLYSALLMFGSIFATATIVALYQRLREVEPGFALWGLILGMGGAGGAAIHGAYDLANAVLPPSSTLAGLPSAIDPRGFLTFGLSGLAVLVIAWLIVKGRVFSAPIGYVGFLSGILSLVLYVGRLVVFDSKNLVIAVPALVEGLVVYPLWYVGVGWLLWRGKTK